MFNVCNPLQSFQPTRTPPAAAGSSRTSGQDAAVGQSSTEMVAFDPAPPARTSAAQTRFQQDRNRALNATLNDVVANSSHLPIASDAMVTLRSIKQTLSGMDHDERMPAARAYIKDVYAALGKDQQKVIHDLYREVAATQTAGAINTAFGIVPTVTGRKMPGLGGAIGTLGMQAVAQLLLPYVGVLTFNTLYGSVDFQRKTGMPGRSRPVEMAKSLKDTHAQLQTTSDALEQALHAAKDAIPGSPEALDARRALTRARGASIQAMEDRMKRERFDDSFDAGRYMLSGLAATKQLAFYASQYVALFHNKDCKGSERAYQMQMCVVGGIVALQVIAAVLDRRREAREIIATNLAYGELANKNHVRDMFRSPYTQKMWLVNDGIEKRTDASLGGLAKLFEVDHRSVKRFDEAGGFNQKMFNPPLSEAQRQAYEAFKTRTEGTPLVPGGALRELEKLVQLEEVGKLHTLEDLSALGALGALEKRHAELAAGQPHSLHAPSVNELKRLPGINTDEQADHLLRGPLPAPLARRLDTLRVRYGVAHGADADAMVTARQAAGFVNPEHARLMLGLDSEFALGDLLQRQAGNPDGALPGPQAKALSDLRAKYDEDGALDDLAKEFGVESKALREGPLPARLQEQLDALQDKYETRGLRGAASFTDVSRAELTEWTDLARAAAEPLNESEEKVRKRLEAKAFKSTLNHNGWVSSGEGTDASEVQPRRDASLTPFEHALLHTLRVRPGPNAGAPAPGSAILGEATFRDVLADPVKMARVQQLLADVRGHRLDKTLKEWDYINLSEPTKKSIENALQGQRGGLHNTYEAAITRWNMPGHVVPALVAQYGRAAFLVVGGSGFFFLMQAATGLVRKAAHKTFVCEPDKGANDASRFFSYVMLGVTGLMLTTALLGAWSGPQAVNMSRMRGGFFRRREGRPTFTEMMKENFIYSASTAVTGYVDQRGRQGPAAKNRANDLIGQTNARLEELASGATVTPVVVRAPTNDLESAPESPPAPGTGALATRLRPTRVATDPIVRTPTPEGGFSRTLARQAMEKADFQRKPPVTANRSSLSNGAQRLAFNETPDGVDESVLITSYSHDKTLSHPMKMAANMLLDVNMYLEERLQAEFERTLDVERLKQVVELVHRILPGGGIESGLPTSLDDADWGDLRQKRLDHLREQLSGNYTAKVLDDFFHAADGSEKAVDALRDAAEPPLSAQQQLQLKLVKMLFGQAPYFGGSSEYRAGDKNSFEYWIYHLSTITRDPSRALLGDEAKHMLKPMRDYLTPEGSPLALNNQSNLGLGVAEARWEELSGTMRVAIKRQLEKHLDITRMEDVSKRPLYTTSRALWNAIRADHPTLHRNGTNIDQVWNELSEDEKKVVYGDVAAIPWEDAHLEGQEGMMNVAGLHGNVLQTPEEAADRYIRQMQRRFGHTSDTDMLDVPRPDGTVVQKSYAELRADFLASHGNWYRTGRDKLRPMVGGMSGHTLGYLNLYKDALRALSPEDVERLKAPSLEEMRVMLLAALVGQKRHHSYDEVMAASVGMSAGSEVLGYDDRAGFRDLLDSKNEWIKETAKRALEAAVDGYQGYDSGTVLSVLTEHTDLRRDQTEALKKSLGEAVSGYVRNVAAGNGKMGDALKQMAQVLDGYYPKRRESAGSVRTV